jgi:hypothetical protein
MTSQDWDDDYDVDCIIFGEKTCDTCGKTKPRNHEHFHRDADRPDGFSSRCSVCRNEHGRSRPPRSRRRQEVRG